jgi:hypothetical protein
MKLSDLQERLSNTGHLAESRPQRRILYFFALFPGPLFFIAFGWLFFLFSVAVEFRVPSSGAVLVCAALIAEVLSARAFFRTWPIGGNYSTLGAIVERPDSMFLLHLVKEDHGVTVMKNNQIYAILDYLKVRSLVYLSKEGEWIANQWAYWNTIERLQNQIMGLIIITTFLGTIVWGYGDMFWR